MSTKSIYGSRWRWTVARWLDKLPGQCWAELVGWVQPWSSRRRVSPWSPVGPSCLSDAPADDPTWRCYCGKVGADGKVWRGDAS